jgi:Rap1a immunity proteins
MNIARTIASGIVSAGILLAAPASADSPDISARRLLAEWNGPDLMLRAVAEMIAAAFAGGLSWRGSLAGKDVFCPPPGLTGAQVKPAFMGFLADHPEMAEKPYGDAMAASLSQAFPCQTQ